jgi:hypothetical protein
LNLSSTPTTIRPAHVHVFRASDEVIINLGDSRTLPSVTIVYRMRTKDIHKALEIVIRELEYFLTKWRQIHGSN